MPHYIYSRNEYIQLYGSLRNYIRHYARKRNITDEMLSHADTYYISTLEDLSCNILAVGIVGIYSISHYNRCTPLNDKENRYREVWIDFIYCDDKGHYKELLADLEHVVNHHIISETLLRSYIYAFISDKEWYLKDIFILQGYFSIGSGIYSKIFSLL